jgi:hypothetical protein
VIHAPLSTVSEERMWPPSAEICAAWHLGRHPPHRPFQTRRRACKRDLLAHSARAGPTWHSLAASTSVRRSMSRQNFAHFIPAVGCGTHSIRIENESP